MTFECEFCHRKFQRERTVAVHMCEPKRRRLSRGERGVELGFQAYIRFYEITQGSAQTKTFDDFCESPYYRAFVKWGHYCVNARVINPTQFLEWLLRNNRKIDHWASDRVYDEFLLYYLQNENMDDAVSRAIKWSIDWGEQNSAPAAQAAISTWEETRAPHSLPSKSAFLPNCRVPGSNRWRAIASTPNQNTRGNDPATRAHRRLFGASPRHSGDRCLPVF